jgi:hypothetical protein
LGWSESPDSSIDEEAENPFAAAAVSLSFSAESVGSPKFEGRSMDYEIQGKNVK